MEENLNKSKTQQYLLDNAYAEWALNANKGFRKQPSYDEYYTLKSSPENVERAINNLDFSNLALVDEGQLNQSYNPDLARDGGGYDQPWELYSDGRYEILSHDLNVGDFGIGDQHLTIYTDNIEVASAHYLDFGAEEQHISEELKTIFWVRDILKNQLKCKKTKIEE